MTDAPEQHDIDDVYRWVRNTYRRVLLVGGAICTGLSLWALPSISNPEASAFFFILSLLFICEFVLQDWIDNHPQQAARLAKRLEKLLPDVGGGSS